VRLGVEVLEGQDEVLASRHDPASPKKQRPSKKRQHQGE
jgi:hypothetical protein